MAWLMAYEWERNKFSDERNIEILPQYRIPITKAILKHYGLNSQVALTTKGGGLASYRWNQISLGRPGYPCCLGTIYHEVAHMMNKSEHDERGHTGTFKKCLIKVYIEMKYELPRILERINREMETERAKSIKVVEKVIAVAEKKADAKAYRKTRAYKIEKRVRQIAKLEKKLKTISTRLKSAKRSLASLQRAETSASQTQTPQESHALP